MTGTVTFHRWTYTCPVCRYQAHGTTEIVARRRFLTSPRHARRCPGWPE